MQEAIKIVDLKVCYPNFTLGKLNLSIPKGVILGIIGKNGAGKTTLINTITNINKEYTGTVFIDSNAVWENEINFINSFALVPDSEMFNPFTKIKKLLKIFAKSFNSFNKEFFLAQAERFNIDLSKRISKLSFGTKKKLHLILMMSLGRDLLILDEPTAGVDPLSKNHIIKLLQTYIQDGSKTVFLSTHETNILDRVADYILFLDDGQNKLFEAKDDLINSHYLISFDNSQLTADLKNNLIYYKEGSFGCEALTTNYEIIEKYNLNYVHPSIAEIMMGYLYQEGELYD